ncbi:Multiple epidermal growth factor-like domains protein 8 [Mortierella sp. AD031]|nr:Multiple epidermal growth factor-like domains protein 8 [Mortierella sp. AD031]
MTTHRSRSHTNNRHRRVLGLVLVATILFSTLSTFGAHAQTNSAPTPVSGPAFARTATRLYILGGNPNFGNKGPPLSQFYSLDLSVPWNASTPAWTELSAGPPQAVFPATFSSDQKTMIVFHLQSPSTASRYDVTTGVWTPSAAYLPANHFQGISAVTDTNTGLVYMAAGYSTSLRNMLDVYDFATDTVTSSAMPAPETALAARAYYGNVWSQHRKSVLYFGGYNISVTPMDRLNIVTELATDSQKWSTLPTSGPPPSMRADHCIAANEDGTMVVIYGGRPANGPYLGDINILNTKTQTWTQGVSGKPRIYTACTISNNQLLVWGGSEIDDQIASPEVLIYNLTSATWNTTYTPPPKSVAPPSESSSPVNAGAIAGGVVAGVAVICACVLFYIFRRRRHARTPVRTTSDHEDTPDDPPKSTSPPKTRDDDELQRMRIQLQNQQEQLDLQRRLLILQQQQQLQMPLQQAQVSIPLQQPQLYPDQNYGYQQQPIYYSLAPTVPTMTSQAYSGQSDLNVVYTDVSQGPSPYGQSSQLTPMAMPPIGAPSSVSSGTTPTTVVASKPAIAVVPVAKPNLSPAGLRHDSNYWEERVPGNPHAIITP